LPVDKKRQEYNWCQIDIMGVLVFPTYRQAGIFPAYGRQASSFPISKENKATGIIADTHINLIFRIKITSEVKKNIHYLR
jgi:hypothetical protein